MGAVVEGLVGKLGFHCHAGNICKIRSRELSDGRCQAHTTSTDARGKAIRVTLLSREREDTEIHR